MNNEDNGIDEDRGGELPVSRRKLIAEASAAGAVLVAGVAANQTDEFNVRAGGGAVIFSASDHSTGVNLAPGAGSWSAWSSPESKETSNPLSHGTRSKVYVNWK